MSNTIAETANNTENPYNDLIQQNPSIKITKNTKGYNFEFKILSLDIEEMDKIHNAITEKIIKWTLAEKTREEAKMRVEEWN